MASGHREAEKALRIAHSCRALTKQLYQGAVGVNFLITISDIHRFPILLIAASISFQDRFL